MGEPAESDRTVTTITSEFPEQLHLGSPLKPPPCPGEEFCNKRYAAPWSTSSMVVPSTHLAPSSATQHPAVINRHKLKV